MGKTGDRLPKSLRAELEECEYFLLLPQRLKKTTTKTEMSRKTRGKKERKGNLGEQCCLDKTDMQTFIALCVVKVKVRI